MATFWSSQLAQEISNFLGGPIQTIEGLSGLGIVIAGYRMINCHQTGCKRFGRFHHGHYRLCAKHHPLVPDDGQITTKHISAIK